MTVRRITIIPILAALIAALTSTPAVAETLVETLSASATQITPVYSAAPLASGTTYRVEVSGTYIFGSGPRTADAEYSSDDNWTNADLYGSGVLDLMIVYGSSVGTAVFNSTQNLTAQNVYWGPYNADHRYSIERGWQWRDDRVRH